MVDLDGNPFLDVHAQIASLPVCYSNNDLLLAATSPEMAVALANRPALGTYPPDSWRTRHSYISLAFSWHS
jgi:4-aminobutyrate aminotransferase/(S)-3-amino-2-methylpropionate transaminase